MRGCCQQWTPAEEVVRVKPWVCLMRVSYREDFVPEGCLVWEGSGHKGTIDVVPRLPGQTEPFTG